MMAHDVRKDFRLCLVLVIVLGTAGQSNGGGDGSIQSKDTWGAWWAKTQRPLRKKQPVSEGNGSLQRPNEKPNNSYSGLWRRFPFFSNDLDWKNVSSEDAEFNITKNLQVDAYERARRENRSTHAGKPHRGANSFMGYVRSYYPKLIVLTLWAMFIVIWLVFLFVLHNERVNRENHLCDEE
ncbi:hypothetical protein EGW08_013380 [Elysia chlorotica]|uniref:Uncharacterized protein n=1 Tax=Elysia chlorotica TaxID=188477 RepID=A0A3S1HGD4_ELYCH|nr:hypothetical protein EGW08_013380 [Elysia chlorotica]